MFVMGKQYSNQEIARAAVIYYAKKEGERLARKEMEKQKKAAKETKVEEKPASKINNNPKPEAKPVETKTTTAKKPEPRVEVVKPVSPKPEYKPAEPKMERPIIEKVWTQPKAEEIKVKPADQKPEVKPEVKNEPKVEEPVKPEAAPVVTKAEEKPVDNQKPEEEPKVTNTTPVVDATLQEAASNTGFNIQHFVKPETQTPPQQQTPHPVQAFVQQQPTPAVNNTVPNNIPVVKTVQSQPQQQAYNPNPVLNQVKAAANPAAVTNAGNQNNNTIVYPEGYSNLSQSQKCDAIRQMIASSQNQIMPVYDPMPDKTIQQKAEELKKHVTFLEGAHKGIDQIQVISLLGLINSPLLRTKMNEYGSVDRPNNPKLFEIPLDTHIREDQKGKYDMAFEVRLKEKKKSMIILFNSVPEYNIATKSWNNATVMFKK